MPSTWRMDDAPAKKEDRQQELITAWRVRERFRKEVS